MNSIHIVYTNQAIVDGFYSHYKYSMLTYLDDALMAYEFCKISKHFQRDSVCIWYSKR